MYAPADEQQSFYQNLMVTTKQHVQWSVSQTPFTICFSAFPQTQLTSRLKESDNKQDEEEEPRRRSPSVVSDRSQSSRSSQSSTSSSGRRKQQQRLAGDPVVSATLRQLQQLGVDVDKEDLTESDRSRLKAVESARYLMC